MTLTELANYEDVDFTEALQARCYYKVKLIGCSDMHAVWLPYHYAVESTKFKSFHRKLASWHTELNSVSSLVDNLESNLKA